MNGRTHMAIDPADEQRVYVTWRRFYQPPPTPRAGRTRRAPGSAGSTRDLPRPRGPHRRGLVRLPQRPLPGAHGHCALPRPHHNVGVFDAVAMTSSKDGGRHVVAEHPGQRRSQRPQRGHRQPPVLRAGPPGRGIRRGPDRGRLVRHPPRQPAELHQDIASNIVTSPTPTPPTTGAAVWAWDCSPAYSPAAAWLCRRPSPRSAGRRTARRRRSPRKNPPAVAEARLFSLCKYRSSASF